MISLKSFENSQIKEVTKQTIQDRYPYDKEQLKKASFC